MRPVAPTSAEQPLLDAATLATVDVQHCLYRATRTLIHPVGPLHRMQVRCTPQGAIRTCPVAELYDDWFFVNVQGRAQLAAPR